MKLIIVGLCLAALACSSVQGGSRIASGMDTKPEVVPDFVSLMISFEEKSRTCGGTLIKPNYVLTSASCVFDASEEKAQMVTVIFNGRNKVDKDSQNSSNIIIMEGYEGTKNDSAHNLALIKLSKAVKKTKTIDFATLDFNSTDDAYLGKNLIVCGFGNIDNKKTKAKNLQCTELLGVAKADCTGAPDKTLCTSSPKDNNVCGGDNGGPAYVNNTLTGRLTQVGIYSFAVDARPNAKCLDGHKSIFTQVGSYLDFINGNTNE
ncbi:unnamed protein product [Diamesa serratosioi]